MISSVTWKYLESADITSKHGFYKPENNSAACGRSPVWYGGKWGTDKEKLDKLKMCKRCIKILGL